MRTATLRNSIIYDIEDSLEIRAGITDVFHALTTARIIEDWGAGPARIQLKAGGRYSFWDGEMFGMIREVQFPTHLVYTLREENWDSSWPDSLVRWDLRETHRGTELSLHHSGLPTRKIREIHRDGWGDYFLGPLKAYLEK